jgi:hypothetical protein
MDLHSKSFYFDVLQKVASNCEKLTYKTIINEGKDYHLDESCTKFFGCNKCLGTTQNVKSSKVLFIGPKAFMQATKKGKAFMIYVFPTSNVESLYHVIPSQYGIVLVLILVHHHISHWAPTREIGCIIPSLIPCA